eukprot:Sspe_Gene.74341::Locus_45974_Transcript_1_1_Confidence_1.000_Length_446::g.74341::m.74341
MGPPDLNSLRGYWITTSEESEHKLRNVCFTCRRYSPEAAVGGGSPQKEGKKRMGAKTRRGRCSGEGRGRAIMGSGLPSPQESKRKNNQTKPNKTTPERGLRGKH